MLRLRSGWQKVQSILMAALGQLRPLLLNEGVSLPALEHLTSIKARLLGCAASKVSRRFPARVVLGSW